MNFDFFRRRAHVVMSEGENKDPLTKGKKILILCIVIAVAFLALGNFGSKTNKKSLPKTNTDISQNAQSAEEIEDRLCKMLSSVKNAGKVSVMITFDETEEKILATNKKREQENGKGEDSQKEASSEETSIMVFDSGSEEKPFVLKEKRAVPSGVFVTATGASDERVRLDIYEAVKALYGVSGHRIKVAEANSK